MRAQAILARLNPYAASAKRIAAAAEKRAAAGGKKQGHAQKQVKASKGFKVRSRFLLALLGRSLTPPHARRRPSSRPKCP